MHKIADYGTNEEFIERAREKYLTIQTNNASKVSSEDTVQSFVVKSSFVDPTGVNAVWRDSVKMNWKP